MKEGWTYKKLGEVTTFQNGFAFKSSLFRKDGLPIVRISSIQDEEIKEDDLVTFYPSDYNVNFDNYRILPKDILIAMSGGTTGKLGINKSPNIYYQNQRVGVIRENKDILNHMYLFYYLHTKSEESLRIASGAAQPNLSTSQIKDYVIPLPTLPEQQKIVSAFDAAFAKIEEINANANKQLSEARILFQKALTKAMEPKEGWEEKKLGNVAKIQNGFAFKSNLFKNEGLPIVRISNIQNGEIDATGLVYFNMEDYDIDFDGFRILPNDILIAMSGGTTGKLGVNKTEKIYYQNQRVGVIREDGNKLNHRYLYYFLHTKSEESLKIAAGAAQPNLSTSQIKDFIIHFPSLSEQQHIVSRLDALSEKIRVLEENQKKVIAECNILKQALLRQVFE